MSTLENEIANLKLKIEDSNIKLMTLNAECAVIQTKCDQGSDSYYDLQNEKNNDEMKLIEAEKESKEKIEEALQNSRLTIISTKAQYFNDENDSEDCTEAYTHHIDQLIAEFKKKSRT